VALVDILARVLRDVARSQSRTRSRPQAPRPRPQAGSPASSRTGDVTGYAPQADGEPDPGEVVWAWVPYEEMDGRGKDRPVVILGTRGTQLLGLMLTSKDHDRDHDDEQRQGRWWMDVGTGAWDRERRPSEVRLDRLLVLDPADVRREGAALDRTTFDAVLAGAREHHALG
jgi:hypothetical protein